LPAAFSKAFPPPVAPRGRILTVIRPAGAIDPPGDTAG
jgi:hypothetical protein